MDVKQFCEGIKLDPNAQRIIYEYQMDEWQYQAYKRQFYANRYSFFENVKQSERYRQLFLYLFVRFAVDAYEEYQRRGIDDGIYFDTFHDIQIWCMTCKRDYDEYGIEEYNWLQEHIQLRLFRVGRLQFQPFPFERTLEVEGRTLFNNQLVLNVHIPSGEPLDPRSVEESFERASTFFRGITPIFTCHTWLLYPELNRVLTPDSNILQFQKHFIIYDVDHESRQAEERIFNQLRADYGQYEEHTYLQRSAKAFLQAGNKLGCGYGIKLNPIR
ncbi:acyltransferase domain-containing protein [Paenibacillus mendelii]|uniref:Acyltransferase domain-containing protein n=1 Tax=Paenibacillus mendelii TaxID=206163 RepID=A0ABV6J5H6_9BACL|nr:acyltransferase domain-containing protein [Paenibacillus mendelii]MCQ6561733.1 acyltransferase domain-containing protein [Paenibacillus mendelii]